MEARDKFLTEAMGECWHDHEIYNRFCNGCGTLIVSRRESKRADFSTWEGFGKLWTWATAEKMDGSRVAYHALVRFTDGKLCRVIDYLNPDSFANAVYEYLQGR